MVFTGLFSLKKVHDIPLYHTPFHVFLFFWDVTETVPKVVQAKLRPYQKLGYQWLKTLAYYGMGGILADDMGLGKTLQAIVYICSSRGEKTLIVCPTSLAYNWQEEFEKFRDRYLQMDMVILRG